MKSKKWKDRVRNGDRVRIYAEDGVGDYPIHGAVLQDCGGWTARQWTANGELVLGVRRSGHDLIPATTTKYANLWIDELDRSRVCGSVYSSESRALDAVSRARAFDAAVPDKLSAIAIPIEVPDDE